MQFGRFTLRAVDAGRFRLDGGAMFGVVPRMLWERFTPADALNRIDLALRLLLIDDPQSSPPRRILVDTGIGGAKFDAKRHEQMTIVEPPGGLPQALRNAGVEPESVTDVILTHLHFDHAGGATERLADGTLVPTLPRAVYHLQRRALKWAGHASEKDAGSFRLEDYEVLAQSGRLHLLDGPTELFPGVSLILSEGHTVGQQLPLVEGHDGKLLYCSDVIPMRAHIRLPWIMSFDLYPLTTLEEKRLLLAQGLEEGWTLFFEHDPVCAACRLSEKDGVVVAGEEVVFA